jgi:NADPH:quinone reductase-like Zn-dependent oxidoreductase
MKAIRLDAFGDAGVLRFGEMPDPSVGPNDVLLHLKAAALNHLDVWVRSGQRERNILLPHVPGSDGAGVVTRVGSAVTGVIPGDSVLISPGLSCGHCDKCLGGRDNLCREYRVLGTKENGTYAEYVSLPAVNVLPIPAGLDFNEAAAIPLVSVTAWHMLMTLARIQPGETVLVHGAGSGVGSMGIQIAKFAGAYVITTAGSQEKLGKAKLLGADALINYGEKNFVEEVKRLTDKRGVDVVFEHIGGEVFEKSLTILAKGGRLVTCGATSQFKCNVDIRYIYARHQSIFGSWMGGKQELIEVLKFFSSHSADTEDDRGHQRLRPVIDKVYPLAQAAEAQRYMEERKNFGKIVLSIS